MFNSEQGDPSVVEYFDSDYTCDMDDMKSTPRYVVTLAYMDLFAKNHQFNSQQLFVKLKHMIVVEVFKKTLWVTTLARGLGFKQDGIGF